MPQWKPVARTTPQDTVYDASGAVIERIPFRAGVSSVTVENMAKREGCVGGQGAGLMTAPGPVEVYRMICESRRVYVAKCEFRQCKSVNPMPAGGYATRPPHLVMPTAPQQAGQVVTSPVRSPGSNNMTVIAVPSDSNVRVVSAPGPRQVPGLAIEWQCGECTRNEKVPPLILAGYMQEALAQGYTVSTTETAKVSIVDYRQRPIGVRIAFGFMAGKDRLGVKIAYRGTTIDANSSTLKAFVGMNAVAEQTGKRAFEQMRLRLN